nr:protein ALP1-like isoform X1 [Bactrocera oleae]
MSVDKFNALLCLIKDKLHRCSRREPINEETRLAITLMYLSQGCCLKFLAWSHKIGLSTLRKIIYETCAAIWNELHTVYVTQPNQSEWRNISERFYIKTGMPHCLGAIDGKHINIACDSDYTFPFVDVRAVGSQNDGGIFAKSAFGKMILRRNIVLPPLDHLPGTNKDFQYFFVGDNAFPLKENLMRPYPGRNLSPLKQQAIFRQSLHRKCVWYISE